MRRCSMVSALQTGCILEQKEDVRRELGQPE